MTKAHLEEVNGTVMIAVPPAILDRLQLSVGSEVEVDLAEQSLVLRPVSDRASRLAELIATSDPLAFERTEEDWEWLNSPPMGRELI